LAGGLLFRLAVDNRGLYGGQTATTTTPTTTTTTTTADCGDGDAFSSAMLASLRANFQMGEELVQKEAGHQLKGLTALVTAGVQTLHFPLMALIEYRGFRLIAMSVLPISPHTLCLGSNNGGAVIHPGDDQARDRVTLLSQSLNLKPHHVTGVPFTLATPTDMEIHKVTTNEQHGRTTRYYACDFARLFPCEAPPVQGVSENGPAYHLVRLLRPELVKSNLVPLSPDAFSRFAVDTPDAQANNDDVRMATERMKTECVRAVAKQLEASNPISVHALAASYLKSFSLNGEVGSEAGKFACDIASRNGEEITRLMHQHGVNMRHLGLVHAACSNRDWKRLLLTEAVARCLKNHTRQAMRQTA
jgi:hypothetical protein